MQTSYRNVMLPYGTEHLPIQIKSAQAVSTNNSALTPTIIGLHGIACSNVYFDTPLIKAVTQAGFNFIAPNFPGNTLDDNGNGWAKNADNYSYKNNVDLTIALLTKQVQTPYILMGASMGGVTAQLIIQRLQKKQANGDLVAKQLLNNLMGVCLIDVGTQVPLKMTSKIVDNINKLSDEPTFAEIAKLYRGTVFANEQTKAKYINAKITAQSKLAIDRKMPAHLLGKVAAEAATNKCDYHNIQPAFEALVATQKPLLVLWGEKSPILTKEVIDDMRAITQNKTTMQVIACPEAGHVPVIETPTRINQVVSWAVETRQKYAQLKT